MNSLQRFQLKLLLLVTIAIFVLWSRDLKMDWSNITSTPRTIHSSMSMCTGSSFAVPSHGSWNGDNDDANSNDSSNDDVNSAIDDLGFHHPLAICRSLAHKSRSSVPRKKKLSTMDLWRSLQHTLLNATLSLQPHPVPEFAPWIQRLWTWYNVPCLQRSISVPPSHTDMQRILRILEDFPMTREPLRVLVMGGSVTYGTACHVNHIGQTFPPGKERKCAWPKQLEALLQQVLLDGTPMIQLTNLANGGYSSGVGAMMLQYHLFPHTTTTNSSSSIPPLPDVVVWAHAANDRSGALPQAVSAHFKRDFIRAARNMRPCDAPLVLLVDDFFGGVPSSESWEQSMQIYEAAIQAQAWSVSYANVVRSATYQSLWHSNDFVQQLFGSEYVIHLGLGFHIGMAWVMLYNILDAIVNACNHQLTNDIEIPSSGGRSDHDNSPVAMSNHPNLDVRPQDDQVASTATPQQTCKYDSAWSYKQCTFAWIQHHSDVLDALETRFTPYMKHNEGWRAEDNALIKKPGWYAFTEKARFSLRFSNLTSRAQHLNILSLRSYESSPFNNSLLNLTISVSKQGKSNYDEQSTSSLISGGAQATCKYPIPY
jgi:hypothetical protein